MSGHSKWSTIKRQKGANDAKRAQLFTKLSKGITLAVQQGGGIGDPASNFKLRLAIETARGANMPKDNIERAIQRASGKQEANLEEGIYEGFGPGGFSVIVETLTDNNQRTVAEVKNAFNKNGGNLGNEGSVLYQFEKKGIIAVVKDPSAGSGQVHSLDDIFSIAADSGAEDVEDAGDEVMIYTSPSDLAKARDALLGQGLSLASSELTWKPVVISPITDKEAAEKALNFIDKLESLDDVQKVYANFDIPDELL